MATRRSLLVLFLVACGGGEPESTTPVGAEVEGPGEATAVGRCAIEGRWSLTAPEEPVVGPNGEAPIPVSKDYTFADGRFRMDGYPALVIEGGYRLTWTDGAAQLEMTDVIFDGTPRGTQTEAIEFDDDCDTFRMRNDTFARRED